MRYLFAGAAASATLGVMALFEAARRPSWVDANGFLHEPFAWMASGRLLLMAAALLFLASGVAWMARLVRERRRR